MYVDSSDDCLLERRIFVLLPDIAAVVVAVAVVAVVAVVVALH